MTDKKTFGSFIKAKRLEKNYSQKTLAELLYVTESAVSKWERGASYPDITLIGDICRVLDISEHEFITASTDTTARKLQYEARRFRVISGVWFWTPTAAYAVALIVCFICNLAAEHTLSWFFVVFASLLCAYSFVPTYTYFFKTRKLLVFTVTSLMSICVLLFTCAVYTHSVFWVPTACIGVMIGYSLIFLPLVLSKSRLSAFRFVISFAAAFLLTVLLTVAVNAWHPIMLKSAILMISYGFFPLILCACICFVRFNALLKAGICVFVCSLPLYFSGYTVDRLFGTEGSSYRIDFANWSENINGNIMFIILLALIVLSVAFICTGLLGAHRKKKKRAVSE